MGRSQSSGFEEMRWGRVGLALFTVGGIAALTMGYALQRGAHDRLGVEIRAVEDHIQRTRNELRGKSNQVVQQGRRETLLVTAAELGVQLEPIPPTRRLTVPLISIPAGEGLPGSSSNLRARTNGPVSGVMPLPSAPGR